MLPFSVVNKYGNTVIQRSIVSYDLGRTHFSIVDNTGRLLFYGFNQFGSMGTGTVDSTTQQEWLVSSIDNVSRVFSNGSRSTVVIRNDGTVWMCGTTTTTQFGNVVPVVVQQYNWIDITANMPIAVNEIKSIKIGQSICCIVSTTGVMYSTGVNATYQLTNTGAINGWKLCTFGTPIQDVYLTGDTTSTDFSIILDNTGAAYGCGSNSFRQITNTATSSYAVYTPTNTSYTFSSIKLGSNCWVGLSSTGVLLYNGVAGVVNASGNLNTFTVYNSVPTGVYIIGGVSGGNILYQRSTGTSFYGSGVQNGTPILNTNTAVTTQTLLKTAPVPEGAKIPYDMLSGSNIRDVILLYSETDGTTKMYALGLLVGQSATANAQFINIPLPF
jgi:alpha-tubulin suppressor-like RCC1 family protein